MKKNILYIMPALMSGGTEAYLMNILSGISPDYYSVTILSHGQNDNPDLLKDLKKRNVSFENAEKVVKPPRKPVVRNIFHVSEIPPRSKRPKTSPIQKQPMIFTASVPVGKAVVFGWIAREHK